VAWTLEARETTLGVPARRHRPAATQG